MNNNEDTFFNSFNLDFMLSESGSDELEDLFALVTDTDAVRAAGRPTNSEIQSRDTWTTN